MPKIIIKNPPAESLAAELSVLYDTFRNIDVNAENEFDLSQLSWVHPLLLLPIVSFAKSYPKSKCLCEPERIGSYLKAVGFPCGVDVVPGYWDIVGEEKNFIPIGVLKKDAVVERENLESAFSKIVYRTLGSVIGAQNAIYYPISELVGNIFEHSKQDVGYIFGQFYPKKEYLDICIVDCGRGLRRAYLEEKSIALDDENSVLEVLKGNSTKPSSERGYGVHTSKKIVCGAMGGQFIIVSGAAAFVANGQSDRLVTLPDFNWQGVIVAYRIPKPKGPIDISPYLE